LTNGAEPSHITRTSTNIAPYLWIWHAPAQPLDSRALGFLQLALDLALNFCGDLVKLFMRHAWPLRVQPRRTPRDPFLPVHFPVRAG
jgi:hypothetical protein